MIGMRDLDFPVVVLVGDLNIHKDNVEIGSGRQVVMPLNDDYDDKNVEIAGSGGMTRGRILAVVEGHVQAAPNDAERVT